jgi:hypothetical protein
MSHYALRKPLPRWRRFLRQVRYGVQAIGLLLWGVFNLLLMPCLMLAAIYRLVKGW